MKPGNPPFQVTVPIAQVEEAKEWCENNLRRNWRTLFKERWLYTDVGDFKKSDAWHQDFQQFQIDVGFADKHGRWLPRGIVTPTAQQVQTWNELLTRELDELKAWEATRSTFSFNSSDDAVLFKLRFGGGSEE